MAIAHDEAVIDRALTRLMHGTQPDPFFVLGPHRVRHDRRLGVVVRACLPAAERVEVVPYDNGYPAAALPMDRRHPGGIFEARFDDAPGVFDYRLRVTYPHGHVLEIDDPYRYGRVLTDFDLHLFNEGTHHRLFEKFGAHVITIGNATGVHFAVWAPNAERVSVVGDFNGWDGRVHVMRQLGASGVWEIFIPGLQEGERYKYEVLDRTGVLRLKADPLGFFFEIPPASASIVRRLDRYEWRDAPWMRERAGTSLWHERPMSIYEVHLGSWARVPEEGNRSLTYGELAGRLIPYVKQMGFTHIELLPVMEHPYSGSWGYQVTGFFAPTSRFGSPEDFKYFIDECHQYGIGVILDWVPGHFPKDDFALARFDGTGLYEHEDPRQGEHQDWGTLIFNYGRHKVRNFLLSNALFWLDEYHVDGLRVDAVASMLYLDYSRQPSQWVPNRFGGRENLDAVEFLRTLNTVTHEKHLGSVTIAEESTAWPAVSRPVYVGGLGFSYKWNMGWMHDMLRYMGHDPIHRRWHHNNITFSMLYAFTENFILPFSHDEVVHGKGSIIAKMPGDVWQKHANLRALYSYMFGHPGKKLLFMGAELAQWAEWNHDGSLDWHLTADSMHEGVRLLVRDLNHLYQREPSLHEIDFDPAGFQWIDANDHENSVISFIRRARRHEDFTIMVVNFTPVPRHGYRVGVPQPGWYAELLNTDAAMYGGSNMGNGGGVNAEPVPSHGHPWSLSLVLPPLGSVLLKPE